MILIKFKKAHKYLDDLGVRRLDKYNNNVIIDRVDFTEQENEGNIEWRDDGVYLKIEGNFQRGFMYIREPNIQKYGLPRFHLLECRTILEQRQNGRFSNHYFWSNSPTVTLFDRATRNEVKDSLLSLCNNCKIKLEETTGESISDTEEFHNILDLNDNEIETNHEETETDIFNRPLNWRNISRAYRLEQNYICEECGFGGNHLENNYDKRYIHAHHIDGYNLLNTHRNNLKAVCILCHYNQNEHHKSNFERPRLKIELNSFVTKYRNKLLEIENPYIKNFIIENEV